MFDRALKLVFGTKHERDIKKMLPIVSKINSLSETMRNLTGEQITAKTVEFRQRLERGESPDAILPEAFALVREAAWRTLGMRHFDVQLMGGIVLHQGKIAEMKTGEGKTLTSTLAIYLNALEGKGVHVVTVNDYLARRDAMWMKPVYDLLGVSVGFIQNQMDFQERQRAYACDITYGTNNEFGFDYLRDNMVQDLSFRVQRGHHYAIVDEVDSILIDEARTPLIISGPTEENTDNYRIVDRAVRKLIEAEKKLPPPPPREVEPGKEEPHVIYGNYYDIDEKSKNVLLTEEGIHKIEELLGVTNLYAPEHVNLVAHTSQALRAHLIYRNEVDYVVKDGEVIIVDEHTGRLMIGRRYSDGLHQAIEAKENVEIKQETQTLATITFQNFFRMYKKLAGMTGTADTEAEEFKKIYRLDVVVIPTNVPVRRIDYPDRVYKTEKEKFNAILKEIMECHERQQPVLVGTISIEKSEYLSGLLKKHHIPHSVLNAKHHEREAEIVENAGRPGAVTVATNMAGRGTDIVLGGAPTFLKDLEKLEDSDPAVVEFRESLIRKQYDAAREAIKRIEHTDARKKAEEIFDRSQIWLKFHNQVIEAGGLHIIGSERHESRRIDNQLRGRAGRQGDPGSSRFYLCLEDTLMRLFGGDRWRAIMERIWVEEGQELEARMVDRAIARAQKRVENHNFDIRKHLLEYDDVMNRQREIIYAERDRILHNNNVREMILDWTGDVIESRVLEFCDSGDPDKWQIASLIDWFRAALGFEPELDPAAFKKEKDAQVAVYNHLVNQARQYYENKIAQVGESEFEYVERRITLDIIDIRWKEHLYQMDHLREGIWASSYSEKNPLVEYKIQGFRLFEGVLESIKEQVVEALFRIQIMGPVERRMPEPQRIHGEEHHAQLNSFGSMQEVLPGLKPAQKPSENPIVVSSGGASRRRNSRRSRRR